MCWERRNGWIKASNSCQMDSFSRYVPNVFAARAVDQQHQAKGGMHSGLMTSPCVMIVPNSLLKVHKVVIVHSRSFLSCLGLNQPVWVGRGPEHGTWAWHSPGSNAGWLWLSLKVHIAVQSQNLRLCSDSPKSPLLYCQRLGLSACKHSSI